jgi:hypothetical protein
VQVSEQGVKTMLPTGGADLFVDRVGATQLQPCGSPRIPGRESAGNECSGSLFQVMLHLIGDIVVGAPSLAEYA